MQFWVYILRCRDGSYYTGHTDNLEKRMWEHHEGKGSDWTKRRLPVELVWCDWAGTRYEALEFERRVKNWSAAKKEALIAGDWERVGYFAKPPHERPPHPRSTEGTAPTPHERPSTSLRTNEAGVPRGRQEGSTPDSFVPSEVEGRIAGPRAIPQKPA
jgi:predicted GIY-YIG superfamily endonuclease